MSEADARRRWSGFYFITDSHLTVRGVVEDVRAALGAGVALVQYREKEKAFDERRAEAEGILALCRASLVPLIINDDIRLARETLAAGVHLGPDDAASSVARRELGPEAIIGVSVGRPDEARDAEAAGADYLAVGPVFATATKPDTRPPVGIEGVRAVRAATELPLAAIGGLDEASIPAAVEAGADLVCAISASLAGGRVGENIARMKEAMRGI
ncbi:MAG: thiamine phosphate synthase [Planctomycetota bacterium]|jgi:thiamine-phosphate diphosphorylase